MEAKTPGARLRALVAANNPLIIVGTINAMCALVAKKAGHQALYLSGAGLANADFGVPDIGMTSLTDFANLTAKITQAVDLPLLVDADTGFGDERHVANTVRVLEKAGAAGIHLEDQVWPKRCGHLDGKEIIPFEDMILKLQAAKLAKADPDFLIMARTDSVAVEGKNAAIKRCRGYIKEGGADAIFAEALGTLEEYKEFVEELSPTPVLANITEFGKTPLFSASELQSVGVAMMLFPLSAFRAMNAVAFNVYQDILANGTQANLLEKMQTRKELYELIDYDSYK